VESEGGPRSGIVVVVHRLRFAAPRAFHVSTSARRKAVGFIRHSTRPRPNRVAFLYSHVLSSRATSWHHIQFRPNSVHETPPASTRDVCHYCLVEVAWSTINKGFQSTPIRLTVPYPLPPSSIAGDTMSGPSPSPSPKPSFRSRVGTLMRRSSFGTHHKSESKTSLSDSSTKGSNLKVGTTLEPQITPHTVVSPVAESPAREAEASRPSPIVAPSPLGAILGSRPQEAPAPTPLVSSDTPAPRLTEPESQVVESPPNLSDSPQAHASTLPVVEQSFGEFSDYVVEPQPTVAKTPDIPSREIWDEPDSTQPQSEPGFEPIDNGFGINVPIPEPAPVSIPTPEPAPVSIPTPEPTPAVIQVPEQQVPPPTRVVSDVRELPLMGPTLFTPPPSEDHSPWASVITRKDNLSSQPRTPPNPPRALSPKQSRGSFAGTVFESVNGSQHSIPRQISNRPSKTSLAPSYTWSTRVDPQPKLTPQVVDQGTNGDARTISSARYDSCTAYFI